MTDLHLNKTGTPVAEVNTRQTFHQVLQKVRQESCDWLVITGDIAHDEQRETYSWLKDQLADLGCSYQVIPGNHDNPSYIVEVFGHQSAVRGSFCWQKSLDQNWLAVGLDTHIDGAVAGRLGQGQLEWLQSVLADADKDIIIFMHHHAVPSLSAVLNESGLADPQAFTSLCQRYLQIKAVFNGHIHHEFSHMQTTQFYGTPSTCFQIDVKSNPVSLSEDPPAYRRIELTPGGLRTSVVWV